MTKTLKVAYRFDKAKNIVMHIKAFKIVSR